MLSPKDLADRLQLSRSMVYRLLTSGEIECYRIGSAYRVSEEQLIQFLQRHRQETAKRPHATRRHF
jgi:excisionase family DNA binding protein